MRSSPRISVYAVLFALCVFGLNLAGPSVAQGIDRATAQTVYVPSYARVLTNSGRSEPVASTLVVHNIDPQTTIVVTQIAYYSKSGDLVEQMVADAVQLSPFESTYALVPIDRLGEGIGANFIVSWTSEAPAIPPIVEAVMVGGSGTQGISFASRGRVIAQTP